MLKPIIAAFLGVLLLLGLMFTFMTNDSLPAVPTQAWVADLGHGNKVFLNDLPCTAKKIQAQLPDPADIKYLKAGSMLFEGKTLEVCWFRVNADMLFLIDETQDTGFLPTHIFVRTTSISLQELRDAK